MGVEVRLLQGNEACVHGAMHAGMKFFAGYPITPSTEIAEISSLLLPKAKGSFIQMEEKRYIQKRKQGYKYKFSRRDSIL